MKRPPLLNHCSPALVKKLIKRLNPTSTTRYRTLSMEEALNLFRGLSPSQTVTLYTRIDPKAEFYASNPHRNLWKVSWVAVTINNVYSELVNKQRLKEKKKDDFTPLPRVWGRNIMKPLATHTKLGEYPMMYVNYVQLKRKNTEYYTTEWTYIPESELKRYRKPYRQKPIRQALKKPIEYRSIMVPNVLAFTIEKDGGREVGYVIDFEASPPVTEKIVPAKPPKKQVVKSPKKIVVQSPKKKVGKK